MAAAKEIDLAQLPAFLTHAANVIDRSSYRVPLQRCKVALVSETKQNFAQSRAPDGSPWASLSMARPRGGTRPLRDRGVLMASVTAQGRGHVERIDDTTLVWGTNLDYAGIHQHGGVITPKSGRALAIPLTVEAQRAGSPRNMPGLFVLWRPGAPSGLLVERGVAGGRGRAHYVLKTMVRIPPRPFLGWNAKLADKCNLIFADWAEEEIAKG